MEKTPKVFISNPKMLQKSLSVNGGYGDFELFYLDKVVSDYAKYLSVYRENINVWGECAKSVLPYMENTPSQRICSQNQKNFR